MHRMIFAAAAIIAVAAGCSRINKPEIVAASPTAITIKSNSLTEPDEIAKSHCKQYGKNVVSRGGIKLGSPAYSTLWGYDCVEP